MTTNNENFNELIKEALDVKVPTHNFVKQKEPDRHAAAMRLAATETMLDNWYYEVNKTNTREMPLKLLSKYEEVYEAILAIRDMEQSIAEGYRMNTNTKKTLDSIFEIAARDRKGDYRIYDSYQRQIQKLGLSPKEYESAVIKLSKVLKV